MRTVTSRCSRRALARRVLLSAPLGAMIASLPVAAGDMPISATVAGLYIGREQVVEERVESAQRLENTVQLRLGPTDQSLTVFLVIGLLSRFPAHPDQHYLGKEIRVSGTIESFRGVPEITVNDPDHIQVVDRSAASSATSPAAVTGTTNNEAVRLRQQVDQLRAQMQELEMRLKQLEREPPQP